MLPSQAAIVLAVAAAVVSAQMSPQNTTGLGSGHPSGADSLLYYTALQNPTFQNAVSFQGFNWSVPITNMANAATSSNSTDSWTLQLNYTNVTVPGNITTGITTFALDFPGGPWDVNGSDWTLCASIVADGLPSAVSSKKGNNSDGSCVPYLGQACVDAYITALENAAYSTSDCLQIPFWSTLDACQSAFSGTDGNEMSVTTAISNTTLPDIVYLSNGSYYDVATNQSYTLSTLPSEGLSSGQGFAYNEVVFSDTNLAAASKSDATQLQLVTLQMIPNLAFRNRTQGGFAAQPNIRMICGRADTSIASHIPRSTAVMLAVSMIVCMLLLM